MASTARRLIAFTAALCITGSIANAAVDYSGVPYVLELGGVSANTAGWYAFQSTGSGGNFFNRADGEWASRDLPMVGGSIGVAERVRDVTIALVLRNATTSTFDCFTLSFFAEQWRVNTLEGTSVSGLTFSYGVFNGFTTNSAIPQIANPSTILPHTGDRPDDFTRGYAGESNLDVQAFVFAVEHRPLNGNARANRRKRVATVHGIDWDPGEYLVLRWFADYRTDAVPQVLGIDDLRLSTTPMGVIEFTQIDPLPNGDVQMVICGTAGETYDIQTSGDLRNWNTVLEAMNVTGKLEFKIAAALQLGQRYFRAVKR